ncbi:helix-turn-helix transcriptional regulator [Mucilaginibacter sp. CAU 1740]|uniref:helix-turn-helix transcriptional regulator n=1 Tax=Mucilaginibacter sp. CAU 1740 TaxID=3140365 RepID=UPI00325B6244
MSTATNESKNIHHGRNIKRFREMLGLKQEALAIELGDDWSQRRVSLLEAKETIEDEILAQIAAILRVPVEAIKNFDEEKAIYNIQNNYEGSNNQGAQSSYSTFNFNPIDKLIELFEENKQLYERLLASEREKVELLKNKS